MWLSGYRQDQNANGQQSLASSRQLPQGPPARLFPSLSPLLILFLAPKWLYWVRPRTHITSCSTLGAKADARVWQILVSTPFLGPGVSRSWRLSGKPQSTCLLLSSGSFCTPSSARLGVPGHLCRPVPSPAPAGREAGPGSPWAGSAPALPGLPVSSSWLARLPARRRRARAAQPAAARAAPRPRGQRHHRGWSWAGGGGSRGVCRGSAALSSSP